MLSFNKPAATLAPRYIAWISELQGFLAAADNWGNSDSVGFFRSPEGETGLRRAVEWGSTGQKERFKVFRRIQIKLCDYVILDFWCNFVLASRQVSLLPFRDFSREVSRSGQTTTLPIFYTYQCKQGDSWNKYFRMIQSYLSLHLTLHDKQLCCFSFFYLFSHTNIGSQQIICH